MGGRRNQRLRADDQRNNDETLFSPFFLQLLHSRLTLTISQKANSNKGEEKKRRERRKNEEKGCKKCIEPNDPIIISLWIMALDS